MLVKSQAKYIQSLGQKKSRDAEKRFVAEGPKIVEELLSSSLKNIEHIYALASWIELHPELSVPHSEISDIELEKISQLQTTNEVIAVLHQYEPKLINPRGKITLALDTIQDPGNLGTIIRIADWFGVEQIICSPECADIYNPKVVQATMGSIARVTVQYAELNSWLAEWKSVPSYAASLEGTDIHKMGAIAEGILIIGNESRGISGEVLEQAQIKITIPKVGKAESLNAAVATGIILAQICNKLHSE
jgi:TrmH family RNA methyltransferase